MEEPRAQGVCEGKLLHVTAMMLIAWLVELGLTCTFAVHSCSGNRSLFVKPFESGKRR